MRGEPNVSYICSRYYRAPELIFGATDYTSEIGELAVLELDNCWCGGRGVYEDNGQRLQEIVESPFFFFFFGSACGCGGVPNRVSYSILEGKALRPCRTMR